MRLVGFLALATMLASTALLVLRSVEYLKGTELAAFEQVLRFGMNPGSLLPCAYITGAGLTILTSMLFGSLYGMVKTYSPPLAGMGVVFVPVYAVLNIVVYVLQLTVVPSLIELYSQPEAAGTAVILLRQVMLLWPASAATAMNLFAYAALGVPSIIFGLLMTLRGGVLKPAGILLALNGAACVISLGGLLAGYPSVASLTRAGGVLFLPAMVTLCFGLPGVDK